MSNENAEVVSNCRESSSCGAIETIIEPHEKDLGGFSVRRVLPTIGRKSLGPWVFFDQMGPAEFPAGPGINVRPHPHVNLATVTYLFEGEILHRDSLGSVQAIVPGDINLMVAGRGIVHSEREREQRRQSPRRLHGLQLWMALPQDDEETEPEFHHYPSADIPAAEVDGVKLRVMIGQAYGLTSPVKTFFKTLYVEALLEAGQTLQLPDGAEERAVYVAEGELSAQGSTIAQHAMAVFADERGVSITASKASRIAIIGGEKIGKRFMEWNFVSSSRERIEQAKRDWREGRFPKVPGDEDEFIPLPGS
tara:strand:- start:98 stop:1018 length:921 start_codon:yes stop_codon:yes gene_type:complete